MGAAVDLARQARAAWVVAQGIVNHNKSLRRRRHRLRAYRVLPAGLWGKVRFPYFADECPRGEEMLSVLLGVSEDRAKLLLCDEHTELPARHARTMADDLERHIGEMHQAMVALREYADLRDQVVKPRRQVPKGVDRK